MEVYFIFYKNCYVSYSEFWHFKISCIQTSKSISIKLKICILNDHKSSMTIKSKTATIIVNESLIRKYHAEKRTEFNNISMGRYARSFISCHGYVSLTMEI